MVNHDDAATDLLVENSGRGVFHPWGLHPAGEYNASKVNLVCGGLGGVVEILVLGVRGGVAGGKCQAAERLVAGSVLAGVVHYLGPQLLGPGYLHTSDPDVGATIKDPCKNFLAEHLGSASNSRGLLGGAERGHALPVLGELEVEVRGPLGIAVLLVDLGGLKTISCLVDPVVTNFLVRNDKGSFSNLSDLLAGVLVVVVVSGRVGLLCCRLLDGRLPWRLIRVIAIGNVGAASSCVVSLGIFSGPSSLVLLGSFKPASDGSQISWTS